MKTVFPFLLAVALFVGACKPAGQTYSSEGFSVVFPAPFETRSSDENTPFGKVHKDGAVCVQPSCDLAFFTTSYPPVVKRMFSETDLLRNEMDVTMHRLGAKVSSSQMNTNSRIHFLDFTFQMTNEVKSNGESRLYYSDQKTFLVSAIYPDRPGEADAFMKSIKTPKR